MKLAVQLDVPVGNAERILGDALVRAEILRADVFYLEHHILVVAAVGVQRLVLFACNPTVITWASKTKLFDTLLARKSAGPGTRLGILERHIGESSRPDGILINA